MNNTVLIVCFFAAVVASLVFGMNRGFHDGYRAGMERTYNVLDLVDHDALVAICEKMVAMPEDEMKRRVAEWIVENSSNSSAKIDK